jgi:hypothetical protein
MPLKPAAQDLIQRRPVWLALSDLFLDTDVSLSREWRIRTLADSTYTIDEIEAILIDEVYPVCYVNMLSVAGEWAGFNEKWLEERILQQTNSRFFKWRRMFDFARNTKLKLISDEWPATKQGVIDARRAADNHSQNTPT